MAALVGAGAAAAPTVNDAKTRGGVHLTELAHAGVVVVAAISADAALHSPSCTSYTTESLTNQKRQPHPN